MGMDMELIRHKKNNLAIQQDFVANFQEYNKHAEGALSDNTVRSVKADMKVYFEWCEVKGIQKLLPYAEEANVKLAIEPLHPMYAGDKSAIVSLAQANDMAEELNHPFVGIAIDVYHLWWDNLLKQEIERCGKNNKIFAFHVCDWLSPTTDMLTDRGLMGEGCIPVKQIRTWVEKAGFKGAIEVEIFSERLWKQNQSAFIHDIKEAYIHNT